MDVLILLSFLKENKFYSSATTSLNEKFKSEKKMLPFVFPWKVYKVISIWIMLYTMNLVHVSLRVEFMWLP
jgi:hypothetical protein